MKKLTDYLKPNILIIFGALLFIYYLNFLSYGGATLARGIIAVIMSAYYLTVGILFVLIGEKFSPNVQKILSIISVSLFAVFMFVNFLLETINNADIMRPTAWTIKILSMMASLALVVAYIIAKINDNPSIIRVAYLFSLIFVLALLLDLLFYINGASIALGDINVLLAVLYALYSYYLFSCMGKAEDAPKKEKTEEQ